MSHEPRDGRVEVIPGVMFSGKSEELTQVLRRHCGHLILIEQSINCPRMTPSDTRDRLLSSARRLFREKGYHTTSVAEILSDAVANSGSLYHFFPTKQALLVGVLEWYVDNLEEEIVEPVRRSTSDPVERVFGMLAFYRDALVLTDLTFGCPIGNLALEFKEPDPEVRELLVRNFDGWCAAVGTFVEEAADRLPSDLDREELARFVLTTMEGGVMQARTHRSLEPFDASVSQLRRYFNLLQSRAAEASTGPSTPNPGG